MVEVKSQTGEENPYKEYLKKCAIVLTGFSMIQSLRLTVTCGSYAVRRFGIDPGETGIFIKMTLNTTEVFCVTGILTTTLYSIVRNNFPTQRKYDKYISIVLTWMNFFAFVGIFLSYYTGGSKGHLTLYYWCLVSGSMAYGMHQSIVINMVTKDVAYYFIGLPLSGVQIILFHVVFRYYYKIFNKENIEFYLVINQIIIAASLWLFASIFWTYSFYDYEPAEECTNGANGDDREMQSNTNSDCSNGKKEEQDLTYFQRIRQALSPFLMNIFGMMFTFFFYPAIAPYELVEYHIGYKIDLCILCFSTTAAIVLVLLVKFEVGPNRRWEGTYLFYHFTWLLFIIYYGIAITLLVCLHHPDAVISRFIRKRPLLVGVITVAMKGCDDIIRGVSTTGVSMQGKEKDGDMATLANCIAQVLLNIFSFIGLGYIKTFRLYDKDRANWPTAGMGPCRSLLFWIVKACSGGWRAFIDSFTLDLRSYFEPQDIDSILDLH